MYTCIHLLILCPLFGTNCKAFAQRVTVCVQKKGYQRIQMASWKKLLRCKECFRQAKSHTRSDGADIEPVSVRACHKLYAKTHAVENTFDCLTSTSRQFFISRPYLVVGNRLVGIAIQNMFLGRILFEKPHSWTLQTRPVWSHNFHAIHRLYSRKLPNASALCYRKLCALSTKELIDLPDYSQANTGLRQKFYSNLTLYNIFSRNLWSCSK